MQIRKFIQDHTLRYKCRCNGHNSDFLYVFFNKLLSSIFGLRAHELHYVMKHVSLLCTNRYEINIRKSVKRVDLHVVRPT